MVRQAMTVTGMCVALLVLAGGLRSYRLGAAPFHVDELATHAEAAALLNGFEGADDSQISRLPRLIPLSHLVHALGYRCFGADELGSRMIIAILGTLTPLLVFLGLPHAFGRGQNFITALLIALWPAHLYHSQENRFYITAFLAAAMCMIAGAQAVARRSLALTVLACLLGLAAVFTQTVLMLLMVGMFGAIFLSATVSRERPMISALGVVAGFSLLVGLLYFGYMRPILAQWNSDVTWSYASLRGLGNSLFHFGWPVAILGGFGAVLALAQRDEQDRYWLAWTALWAGSIIILPQFMPFHPGYAFPFALGFLVLAAKGIHGIYHALTEKSRLAAAAWLALACLMNFPALASHYVDGSCSNYREAANYIRPRVQPSDAFCSVAGDLLTYYLPEAERPEAVELYVAERAIQTLQDKQASCDRVWVVLNYGRATRPDALLRWLGTNATHEFCWSLMRYDSFQYTTDVFLLTRRR